jgi:hypothetical protein
VVLTKCIKHVGLMDGINEWDYENQNWKRNKQNMYVILKILKNPKMLYQYL